MLTYQQKQQSVRKMIDIIQENQKLICMTIYDNIKKYSYYCVIESLKWFEESTFVRISLALSAQ